MTSNHTIRICSRKDRIVIKMLFYLVTMAITKFVWVEVNRAI